MPAGFYLSNQPKNFDCILFWHLHKSLLEFSIPLYCVCVIRSVKLNGATKRHGRVWSTSCFVIASSRVQKLFQKIYIRMFCWFFSVSTNIFLISTTKCTIVPGRFPRW